MATAEIKPDQYPVTKDMIRAFLAKEYKLDAETVASEYTDERIDVVMSGDPRSYERWRRGAKRQQYGI